MKRTNKHQKGPFKSLATVQEEFKAQLAKKSDNGRNNHAETFLQIAARVWDSEHLKVIGMPDILAIGKTFDCPAPEIIKLAEKWLAHLERNGFVTKSKVSLYSYDTWERTIT
jgi:hypothetical protein